MKSRKYKDDDACDAFKTNTKALNKEIYSLINNPPIPGCGLKLLQQLKSHILFDLEIHDFLAAWRTLGGVDEQNVEGVHPKFNQLVKSLGTRKADAGSSW